jgi:hypothetical protein
MSVSPEMIHPAAESRPHGHDLSYFQTDSPASDYVAQLLWRYVLDSSSFAPSADASRVRLQRVLEVIHAMHSTSYEVAAAMRLLTEPTEFLARAAAASHSRHVS